PGGLRRSSVHTLPALPSLTSTSPATTETSALSLHDALPISPRSRPAGGRCGRRPRRAACPRRRTPPRASGCARPPRRARRPRTRSEEHTSELQSRENLVCRLLLEKKNDDEERQRGIDARIHL